MIYIQMPETLDVEYNQKVRVIYETREVEARIIEGMCFLENGVDNFTIKYLVEFGNRERKWMPMGDIEVIKDEGNDN